MRPLVYTTNFKVKSSIFIFQHRNLVEMPEFFHMQSITDNDHEN